MTKEEVLAMEAGEGLDACIAGWKDGCYHDWKGQPVIHGGLVLRCTKCRASRENGRQLPNQHYSTNILAAWLVVEKLAEQNLFCSLDYLREQHNRDGKGGWRCRVVRGVKIEFACAKEAPEAICKAALLAKLEVNNGS